MGDAREAQILPATEELLNVFALVIYIPDPLGSFLDDLRRELTPDSNPHAHVSVLPPRSLPEPDQWQGAVDEARAMARRWAPFRIEATTLEVFPATDVIYLEVGAGEPQLRAMHAAMNSNCLEFCEPFSYHPHITLAQDFDSAYLPEMRDLASARWAEFGGDRGFMAERAMFVRAAAGNRWVDLAEVTLGG